ncbi:hypothetical protein E3Q19_01360 [Wallemia mellicola]|nr:hypothetical protein E3Q19_01360 [Wallemia mellicola]
MSNTQYDESGQFAGYFTLTFLFLILVPLSLSTLYKLLFQQSLTYPVFPYPKDTPKPRSTSKSKVTINRLLVLLVGWSLFVYIAFKTKDIKLNYEVYDPFEILGLSTTSTQKQIRKHYKKLSLKFHPDKVKLAVNQTVEQADNYFVNLTKAYKSLTDDQTRQNLEQFGHPDGKQEMSIGVAIPTWVVDSDYSFWVLGLYAVLFGLALPYFVGKWWFSSRSLTKDRVLNSTAAIFFRKLDEKADFSQLLHLLATADEMLAVLPASPVDKGIAKSVKAAAKQHLDYVFPTHGIYTRTQSSRAAVLLFAHVLRIDLPKQLQKEQRRILPIALHVHRTLLGISLAHNWLPTTLKISQLSGHLLTATKPGDSVYKSIYNFPAELAEEISERAPFTIARAPEDERKKILKVGQPGGVKEEHYEGVNDVLGRFLHVDIADANFEVVDEQTVTPGAIVQFKTKARLVPARFPLGDDGTKPEDDIFIEKNDTKLHTAYTPYYPEERLISYMVMLTDAKTSKIIVQPGRFTNIPIVQAPKYKNIVKSLDLQFQAPPQPGVYTFRAVVCSEVQPGWGFQAARTMRLLVEKPAAPAKEEDDISEPEEDSLAGQMAQLRGESVKKADAADSDESGTDDDDQEDGSSDSDSGMIVVAFLARLPAMINWVIAGGIQRATFLHKGEIDGPGAYPYSIVAKSPFPNSQKSKPNIFERSINQITPTAHTPLPGLSLTAGQAFVFALATAASIFVFAYGPTNPIENPGRAGWAAVAVTPAVTALAFKNSIVGTMGGWGYEKLNKLHRLLGRLSVLFGLLHTAGYAHLFSQHNTVASSLAKPMNQAGIFAIIGMLLTAVFSIPWCRTHFYNVFWHCHWIGYWMYLIAIMIHWKSTQPFIIPCIVAYGIDCAMRFARSRSRLAEITPHPAAGYTTITIPDLRGGWEAGQHVYVRVQELGGKFFGLGNLIEKHPISIASAIGGSDGLRLIIRSNGDWSSRVLALAQRKQNEITYGSEKGNDSVPTAAVSVEGPYGGPFYTSFGKSGHVLFLAAGSGLAFVLSCAEDLVKQSRGGHCRATTCQVIWIVRDVATYQVFHEELMTLLVAGSLVPLDLTVKVYITRHVNSAGVSSDDLNYLLPHRDGEIIAKRPSIAAIIEDTVFMAKDRNCTYGLMVGICGPPSTVRSCRAAIGGVDPRYLKEIGGVREHCETFGW